MNELNVKTLIYKKQTPLVMQEWTLLDCWWSAVDRSSLSSACRTQCLTWGFLKRAYFSMRSVNISLLWLSRVQFNRFSTKFSWSSKIRSMKRRIGRDERDNTRLAVFPLLMCRCGVNSAGVFCLLGGAVTIKSQLFFFI